MGRRRWAAQVRFGLVMGVGSLLLVACAPKLYVTAPEYQKKTLSCSKLTVYLPPSHIEILNPDDVEDDLGKGDPVAVYYDFFRKVAQKSFKEATTCQTVEIDEVERQGLVSTEFPFPDGSIKVSVPPPAAASASESGESFTLFIQDLKLSRKALIGASGFLGPFSFSNGGVGGPAVYANTNFVLWDDRAGRAVAYGRPHPYAQLGWAVTKRTWYMNVVAFAYSVLEESDSPIKAGRWKIALLSTFSEEIPGEPPAKRMEAPSPDPGK